MFKKLYVMRHGLAIKPGLEYGENKLTAELLPEAVPVVQRLGAYLQDVPCDKFFVSPILRCQQTATIVQQQTGHSFMNDDRLREYHDEGWVALVARVDSFVKMLRQTQAEHVWVCTHGAVMGGLKNLLLRNKFEPDDDLDYPFPGSLQIFEGKTLTTIDFNFQPPKEIKEYFPRVAERSV
jgi:broad specificity phosphatase PhoE